MATYNTRNLRDGVLTVKAPGSGKTTAWHTVALDEGDLSWTETQNVIEVSDRGVLSHIRKGDEAPMEVNFTLKYQSLEATTGTTCYEALKGVDGASNWKSTRDEDVYCVSLQFEVLDTSDSTEETIMFTDFFWTSIEFGEGDEYNTLSVTGRTYQTAPTIS